MTYAQPPDLRSGAQAEQTAAPGQLSDCGCPTTPGGSDRIRATPPPVDREGGGARNRAAAAWWGGLSEAF